MNANTHSVPGFAEAAFARILLIFPNFQQMTAIKFLANFPPTATATLLPGSSATLLPVARAREFLMHAHNVMVRVQNDVGHNANTNVVFNRIRVYSRGIDEGWLEIVPEPTGVPDEITFDDFMENFLLANTPMLSAVACYL